MTYFYYIVREDDTEPYGPKTVRSADTLDGARVSLMNALRRKGLSWYVGIVSKVKMPTDASQIVGEVVMNNETMTNTRTFTWLTAKGNEGYIAPNGKISKTRPTAEKKYRIIKGMDGYGYSDTLDGVRALAIRHLLKSGVKGVRIQTVKDNRMVEVGDVDRVGDTFCYTPFGATRRFVLNKDGKIRK